MVKTPNIISLYNPFNRYVDTNTTGAFDRTENKELSTGQVLMQF